MDTIPLPDNVRRLQKDEEFSFSCHPGVSCFTDCCRELELALTPYDVLRLKQVLALTAGEFLDRYAVIEHEEGATFPLVYLGMVDDGRASCPFVRPEGCRVYAGRPGACRTYPLGRGAFQTGDGLQHDFHVLISEPHCRGFEQTERQTPAQWNRDQGLAEYNEQNDLIMTILQHEQVKSGIRLAQDQLEKFLLGLYKLDEFRTMVSNPDFRSPVTLTGEERQAIAADESALLRFAVRWLKHELFGE